MHALNLRHLSSSMVLVVLALLCSGCGEHRDSTSESAVSINLSQLLAPSANGIPKGSLVRYGELWVDDESTGVFDVDGDYEDYLAVGLGIRSVYIELYDESEERTLYVGKIDEVGLLEDETTTIDIRVESVDHLITPAFTAEQGDNPLIVSVDASASSSTHFSREGLTFSWEWGDRTATPEGKVKESHIYESGGEYRITLTVRDYHASRQTYEEITVSEGQEVIPVPEGPKVISVSPAPGSISACELEFRVRFDMPVDVKSGRIDMKEVSGGVTSGSGFSEELVWKANEPLPSGKHALVVENFESKQGLRQEDAKSFDYNIIPALTPGNVEIDPAGDVTYIVANFHKILKDESHRSANMTINGIKFEPIYDGIDIRSDGSVTIKILGSLEEGKYRIWFSARDESGNSVCLDITFQLVL